MKRMLLIGVAMLVFGSLAPAQERVTLTSPLVTTVSTMHVGSVLLDLDASRITVVVENPANVVVVIKVYDSTTNPTGATLLHSLNIGNFSVNSLMKAVYNRLLTDGVIPAGSITGTAQ
jgi:hypothetical protein